MWKITVEPNRSQMTVRSMHFACWIPKATNPLLEYVTFIALLPKQLLHNRTSVLCDTYIACLVVKIKSAEKDMGIKYLLIVH